MNRLPPGWMAHCLPLLPFLPYLSGIPLKAANRLVFAVALSLCSFASQAQASFVHRAELPGGRDEQHTDVLPLPADSSVIVYSNRLHRHEGDAEKHQFRKYDARLRLRWSTNLHLPAGTECIALTADNTTAYALCTTRDERVLLVIRLDPVSGAGQVLHYRLPTYFTPLAFEVSGTAAYVVTNTFHQQTVVRMPLRDSAAVQFLPTLSGQTVSVSDVAPEPDGVLVMTAERTRESSRLLARRFNSHSGLHPSPWVLQGPYPASLTAGRIGEGSDSLQPRFVAGTYATRDLRYAQGIFSSWLPPAPGDAAPPIFYYDLPTLPHYYDRYAPRHRARASERAQRRRKEGLETIARARLLLHRPLRTTDGGYVLVAEQYYIRYRSDSWGYRSFGTRYSPFAYGLPGMYGPYDPTTAWDRAADGYVYPQALVFHFDSTGRLRWQQSFVLSNLTRPDLREHVAVTQLPDGSGVALAAPTDDGQAIRLATVNGTTPGPDNAPPTSLPGSNAGGERITDTRGVQVWPWLPGRLLVTGFQTVSAPRQRARDVFFIQQLAF